MAGEVAGGDDEGLQRWRIGEVAVSAVLESATAFSPEFLRRYVLPDATRERISQIPWLAPAWADENGDLRFVSQAFLLESQGTRILVDTCLGNDKERKNPAFHRLQTPFLERLLAAGSRPGDVDVVLCTHLHFDHVGWNTRLVDGRWVPTFPRARHLLSRREWEHWGERPGHALVVEDSIRPLFEAGLVDLVDAGEDGFAVTPEVSLVPTPGHTPGHVSVLIRSGGREALITGDLMHHPCQVAHPEWSSPADTDPAQARATREAILEAAAREGRLVMGTHFAPPAVGLVVGGPGGRRFIGV